MAFRLCHLLFWFSFMWPYSSKSLNLVDPEFSQEDRWTYRNGREYSDMDEPCIRVHPSPRDITKRFYGILPFFDREHSNVEFLRKYRATVASMAESDDLLDREAAFYAAVLTPLVFLQNYRNTWCLFERFYRSLRLYQNSHPTEKRSALKLLQNFRDISQKVRNFIYELPGPSPKSRFSSQSDSEDEDLHDKKDIRYIKELIKQLG